MIQYSICIPTFNSSATISRTLNSALEQDFEDFEVVVSDDGSTDDTLALLREREDDRLRILPTHTRLGLVENWNRALTAARGNYACMLNHDDVLLPAYLRRIDTAIRTNEGVGLAFTDMCVINEQDQIIGGHWAPAALPEQDTVWSGNRFAELMLTHGNLVPSCSAMFERTLAIELGGFDSRVYYTLDFEMWLRIALRADVAYVSEPLLHWRRRPGQVTTDFAGDPREIRQWWQAMLNVFGDQTNDMANPRGLFELGVAHLVRWSRDGIRSALEHLEIKAALGYSRLWIEFQRAAIHGPPGARARRP